jgi:phospholipid transport system substrate-binding protein
LNIRLPYLLLSALLLAQSVWAYDDPLQLVKSTANGVLEKVVASKAALNENPSLVYELVSDEVLPHFNFTKMTQSAMGKYWRRATEAQKSDLQEQFRLLLVRTYGVALLNYSGQEIQYMPVKPGSDSSLVTIETKVSEQASGPEIPVDYRLVKDGSNWKVYDVVIDGISLVSNYRTSFSGEIRRSGISGLIETLKIHNQEK